MSHIKPKRRHDPIITAALLGVLVGLALADLMEVIGGITP